MQKFIYPLIFIALFLHADSSNIKSEFVLEGESVERANESQYGVTNCYSFLVAEHKIHAFDHLLFYYGTHLGYVIEDYTAENGFGPVTQEFGMVFQANVGMDYQFKESQKLSFQGSHSQDELRHLEESIVKFGYEYKF